MSRRLTILPTLTLVLLGAACEPATPDPYQELLSKYVTVPLTTEMDALTENERQMLPLLIEAAQYMDDLFWNQAYGDRDSLLQSVPDPAAARFIEINYGPWDRLDGNAPFLDGVGPKPSGANLYPADVSKDELAESLTGQYSVVRRNPGGDLVAIPYHEIYADHLARVSSKLLEAADLAEDPGLRRYLTMRAEALITDDFRPSDMAWMDMKTNRLEIVIGPIENYEDQLMARKTAYEGVVLVKDMAWSDRLSRFAAFLPELQRGLPVPERYKREMPGTNADLNAYDAVYYAGDGNAGSKSIAINLPNDEVVQLEKGARRLQLKNVMRAKFDQILMPIVNVLIAEDQREYVTFDAFFENTMFHEVAHGLGIKNTVSGRGTVREALQEHSTAIEEGKADILGLYMVTALREQGHLTEGRLEDNYVTFMASIFRSVRFGATSAHGRANMVRFNFFREQGAFTRDDATGTYRVDFDRLADAAAALSELLLTLQGDGDYDGVDALVRSSGVVSPSLQADLDRLEELSIPVDVVFEQGMEVLERG